MKVFYCPSQPHGRRHRPDAVHPAVGDRHAAFRRRLRLRPVQGGQRRLWSADPTKIPPQVRGLFNVAQADASGTGGQLQFGPTPQFRVRFTDISDGLSSTFAVGEAAGGNPYLSWRPT